ncbi:hypothetical protein Tco_0651653 [Tanacetum coccineum]|uniref:Uncharacterized protein n=1 Tax=Tanacetum coccineum TaxID=301880 RepID=A0ABQ4WVG6_9ASTR
MAIKPVPDGDPIPKPELTGESPRRKFPESPWGSPIPIGDGDGDVNRFSDGDGDEAEKRGWGFVYSIKHGDEDLNVLRVLVLGSVDEDLNVFSTWMAFGGNTSDLGSFREEMDKIIDLHQIHEEVLFTESGDGIAGIKRRRHDLSSDDVRDLVTTSGRGRLKEDLESST